MMWKNTLMIIRADRCWSPPTANSGLGEPRAALDLPGARLGEPRPKPIAIRLWRAILWGLAGDLLLSA